MRPQRSERRRSTERHARPSIYISFDQARTVGKLVSEFHAMGSLPVLMVRVGWHIMIEPANRPCAHAG
jgi:hypothetical protein